MNDLNEIAFKNVNVSDTSGGAILLGQKTSASSLPVVIASDQTVSVSGSISQNGVAASTADNNSPTLNVAAVITYPAVVGKSNYITGISWSYNGVPTSGNIMVQDGSNVVFSSDITAAGPGFIPFPLPKEGTTNTAMIITLAAGGINITGKVNVLNHYTQ